MVKTAAPSDTRRRMSSRWLRAGGSALSELVVSAKAWGALRCGPDGRFASPFACFASLQEWRSRARRSALRMAWIDKLLAIVVERGADELRVGAGLEPQMFAG